MLTELLFDKETSSAVDSEVLPVWDLTDLCKSMDDPSIEEGLATSLSEAEKLAKDFKGKLAGVTGDELASMIERFEAINERVFRILSFAQLLMAANREDSKIGRFYQSMQERANLISQHLLFVTLEINRIKEARLDAQINESTALAHFRPWLNKTRSYRPHQLSDAAEAMLHEKSVVGRNAWVRLFDQTIAELRFNVDGEDLTIQKTLNLLQSREREQRKAAAEALGAELGRNQKTFALITNTLAKDKEIENGWRKFARPISSRNLANHVEDEIVDALIQSVKEAYPRLSHRYYALKARWMGLDKLQHWDRNAPLPEDEDRLRPFDDAKQLVIQAYGGFEPKLATIVEKFFDRNWIDAEVRAGKDGGAFCHPTVPSAHPYILMNYQGRNRDVMTLAHELGHGVHQSLAAEQGLLMSQTPLTLAETASVFGEQLTFQALLKNTRSASERRVLLGSKIEDMLNTVVRQIAFADFERQVHDRRRGAELTPDELGEIWLSVQTECLGDTFELGTDYGSYWSYVPHFIHAPFYVYAYAFGDCLVNSLFSLYQSSPDGFTGRYLDMLKAGGTKHHRELLAPFGLDLSDKAFWDQGLGLISGMIDELDSDLGEKV